MMERIGVVPVCGTRGVVRLRSVASRSTRGRSQTLQAERAKLPARSTATAGAA